MIFVSPPGFSDAPKLFFARWPGRIDSCSLQGRDDCREKCSYSKGQYNDEDGRCFINTHAVDNAAMAGSAAAQGIRFLAMQPQRLLLGREDPFDLLEVIDVVTSHHARDALEALFAPLGVHAVVLPLFRREAFVQS